MSSAKGRFNAGARRLSATMSAVDRYVARLENVSMQDVAVVGGKNASLGEVLQNLAAASVRVVGGFATTAYRDFMAANGGKH